MKKSVLFVTLLSVFFLGCRNEQPALKLGSQNWKPHGIGGPIESRALPPSESLVSEYQAWIESESVRKARVYETIFQGETNQLDFAVQVTGGDAPLGYTETTRVSFIYTDADKGSYEIYWSRRGRHEINFLRFNDEARKVWLRVAETDPNRVLPRLVIAAIEGVEPDWGVYAEPGGKAEGNRE